MSKIYHVYADWDSEAGIWVATSADVPGLAAEAETIEELTNKLRIMIPELLEANGLLPGNAQSNSIAFELTSHRHEICGSDGQGDLVSKLTSGDAYDEQSNEPLDIGELYVRHRALLLRVAVRKFHVPDADAEGLLEEVFLSLITTKTKINNVRAWLVAAMCNACRHYWRAQRRVEWLPEDFESYDDGNSDDLADQIAREITIRQAMDYLQPWCREILQVHYSKGLSANEIARVWGTKSRHTEMRIHGCLRRVREIYFSIAAVKQIADHERYRRPPVDDDTPPDR